MNNNFRDTRLIEAFEYIDPKYINEVGAGLKLRSVYSTEEEQTKTTFRIHIKQLAVLAACVVLLSLAFPLLDYVKDAISSFASGGGTSTDAPEQTSDLMIETTDAITDAESTQQTDSEPLDAAQFILDWEQSIENYLDQKRKEHPDKLYFNEADEAFVVCYYILTEKNVADSVIEQHDMRAIFPQAVVNPLSSIKMIMIRLAMDDFTQEVCDKMEEIKNTEPLIEKLSTGVEGGFNLAYIPNIEYYCKDATEVEYTVLSPILASKDNVDVIIKSKEEYDGYIDLMKNKYKTDYHLELLETQRELYDEAFFAENALIITRVMVRGSGSIKLSVNNVYTSGDKVYVAVKTVEPGGFGTTDMKYQSFSISVKQSDVVNVKELITLD